jgi:asparagine synthase (glutamine-hydrolysing)
MGVVAGIACRDAARRPDEAAIDAMGEALAHRGPGGAGPFVAPGIGLAGRRPAAIDPPPAGAPPTASEDGQVCLAFDGAIYNHVELRDDLKRRGVRFRSAGDAEVILQLYLREGLEALHRLAGTFALALWDARRRSLLLARDRLGVKPLLYRLADDGLRFASEAAGLLAEPGFDPEPDPQAIHSVLSLRFVPRPGTAYAGIRVLPPAHLLVYEQGHLRLQRYWSVPDPAETRPVRPGELEERHRALMDEAVRVRLRGDAPPALCLSGGIDSAAIAYHMRRNLTRSFRAFLVAFAGEDAGERAAARQASARFGIELHEIEAAPLSTLEELAAIVDHVKTPIADPALVRGWILAREVSRHVKVALVGDGGDEVFGGYDRYRAHLLADRFGWVPGLLSRTPLRALLEAVSTEGSRRDLPGRLRRFLEGWELPARERHVLWMANPGARRIARLYRPEFAARVAGLDPTRALGMIPNDWASPGLIASILRADLEHVLPDDLLFRADAASMAFGLELRSPFLDHRVVEFAAAVPADQKVRLRRARCFLRRAYRGRLPNRTLGRRRGGFGPPAGRWFRGDLQAAARDLLLGESARSRDYLNRDAVAAVLKIDRSGQRNYDRLIWTLLVLEIWLRGRPGRRQAREAV